MSLCEWEDFAGVTQILRKFIAYLWTGSKQIFCYGFGQLYSLRTCEHVSE